MSTVCMYRSMWITHGVSKHQIIEIMATYRKRANQVKWVPSRSSGILVTYTHNRLPSEIYELVQRQQAISGLGSAHARSTRSPKLPHHFRPMVSHKHKLVCRIQRLCQHTRVFISFRSHLLFPAVLIAIRMRVDSALYPDVFHSWFWSNFTRFAFSLKKSSCYYL